MRPDLSIILPTFNEAKNIGPLINNIQSTLVSLNYEVLVVDDSSTDGTIEVVKELQKQHPNLRLIIRTSDRGLIPSINEGIKLSNTDVCLWMDADQSMSPKVILEHWSKIKQGADLSLGSRYIEGGGMKGVDSNKSKTSFFRILSNLSASEDSILSALISVLGNKVLKLILNSDLHDFSSGFFCAKKNVLKDIGIEGTFVDYCISLPFKAQMKGYNVVEVPMVLETRKHGISKTSNSLYSILKIAFECFYKAILLKLTTKDQRKMIHDKTM